MYVPPVANIILPTFTATVAGIQVLPVKSSVSNPEPAEKVGIDAPAFMNNLGLLLENPQLNVLVTDILAANPPVPVNEKLLVVAMANTVAPAVVLANIILLEPNATERTPPPAELNMPVVKLKPFKFNAPAVNV